MYISNITFVLHPEERDRFLSWLRSDLIPALFNPESPARSPRVQTVVEVAGQVPDSSHGLSIALQAEFDSVADAHLWTDNFLHPAAGKFTAAFGPDALYFQTLLETLPL